MDIFDNQMKQMDSNKGTTTARIYKYCPINRNTISALVLGKNWISDPAHFNDPFELTLPSDSCFCPTLNGVLYMTEETAKNKEFVKELNKNEIGIICYSQVEYNILMWSHYADNHRGICLGFEPEIPYNTNCNFSFENLNWVNYSKAVANPNLKEISQNNIRDIYCTKAEDWKYEQEIRQVFNRKSQYADYPGTLRDVIFGCNTPDSDIRLIMRLLDGKGVNFQFCEKQDGQYSLIVAGGKFYMEKYS